MITVLEALNLSTEYLTKKGIESARLNAELMLAHILNCKRLQLYLMFDRPLDENELSVYREFLARRAKREPLQYILGEVEFYNIKLKVNPDVLIPRPETELLVEKIIKDFSDKSDFKFLDIGIGSGNISIALLVNLPVSAGIGIDISDSALALANYNAELNSVKDRLELIHLDILKDDIQLLGKFDAVISNPPYVSSEDFEKLEPELKVYEPQIALTDFYNGLTFYRKIISIADDLLKENGKIYFEIGKGQSNDIKTLMENKRINNINIIKDYQGIDRIICGELK
ncbi:MAG: peptide chain release factor N(5)-glutamine methyltransferase [Ignavibacterium sp.]|uniref:peptide chain release factor N(5)-glutamine methyltransferase n=1 Tax=Ignavibacterium sp. TaxID=2651167 RepID=UPI00404B04DA